MKTNKLKSKTLQRKKIESPNTLGKEYTNLQETWWTRTWIAVSLNFLLVISDAVIYFIFLDSVSVQSEILGKISSLSFTFFMGLSAIFLGQLVSKQDKKSKYIVKCNLLVIVLCISALTTMRFSSIQEPNITSIAFAFLLTLIPIGTSFLGFLMCYYENNPIKRSHTSQLQYINNRIFAIKNGLEELELANVELNQNIDNKLKFEDEKYLAAKNQLIAKGVELKQKARMLLAENIDSITAEDTERLLNTKEEGGE